MGRGWAAVAVAKNVFWGQLLLEIKFVTAMHKGWGRNGILSALGLCRVQPDGMGKIGVPALSG